MDDQPVKLSEREWTVLRAMADNLGLDLASGFDHIARMSGLPREQIRRTVRALARKGMTVFQRALFDDDGRTAGAGYGVTTVGMEFYEKRERPTEAVSSGN